MRIHKLSLLWGPTKGVPVAMTPGRGASPHGARRMCLLRALPPGGPWAFGRGQLQSSATLAWGDVEHDWPLGNGGGPCCPRLVYGAGTEAAWGRGDAQASAGGVPLGAALALFP